MLKAITEACRALAAYLELRALQVQQEIDREKKRNEIRQKIDKAVDAGDTTAISLLAKRLRDI